MIAPDIKILGFSARDWSRLGQLFIPPIPATLWLITDDKGCVIDCWQPGDNQAPDHQHTRDLVIRMRLPTPLAQAKLQIPKDHVVGVVQASALGQMAETFGRCFMPDHPSYSEVKNDFGAQLWMIWKIVQSHQQLGHIVFPRERPMVALPSFSSLDQALNIFLPLGRSFLVGVWHPEGLWTSLLIRRNGRGQIDRIVGPQQIGRWVGPLGGDWSRDLHWIAQRLSEKLAPVHLGIHGTFDHWSHLLRGSGRKRGAWAHAVLTRKIIIDPMPAYMGAAVATDALRAGVDKIHLLLSFLPAAVISKIFGGGVQRSTIDLVLSMRSQWGALASITKLLGFNPIDLWGSSTEADTTKPVRGDK